MGKNLFTFAGKGKPGVVSIPYPVRLKDQDRLWINYLAAYSDPPPDLADLAASLGHGLARKHSLSTAISEPQQWPAKPTSCSTARCPWPMT
jgi:hypothetical protein